jgi:hypothetical protein
MSCHDSNDFIDEACAILSNVEKNAIYEIRMNEFCSNYLNQPIVAENLLVKRPKSSSSPLNFSQTSFFDSFLTSSSSAAASTSAEISENPSPFVGDAKILSRLSTNQLGDSANGSMLSLSTSSPFLPYNKRVTTLNNNNNNNEEARTNIKPVNKHHSHLLWPKESCPNTKIQFQSTPNKSQLAVPDPYANNSLIAEGYANVSSIKTNTMPAVRVNFHSINDLATSSKSYTDELRSTGYSSSSSSSSSSTNSVLHETTSSGFITQDSLASNEHIKFLSRSIDNKENLNENDLT